MNTREQLEKIFSQYTSDKTIDGRKKFWFNIAQFESMEDWAMEDFIYEEKDAQRNMSVKFEWGHNHDFGDIFMNGKMGDRHITIIEMFVDEFGLPLDLTGKNVLDVGVWTGGTTLLLNGMGATVAGIEEVNKYARCADYLVGQFYPEAWKIYGLSLYDLLDQAEDWIEGFFDIIIFPGVLYHLTDPILALRILFNCLKDGGELYIETAGHPEGLNNNIKYYGPSQPGWNWFVPNANVLRLMLKDVGFEVREPMMYKSERIFAKAIREEWKPMLQAGISRRVR